MSERPTIRDVAERAGVSIATVSRVLNDKGDVSDETRERVREVARSVGYTADRAARSLVTQRTGLVAVVGDNAGHRDLSLLFFGKVLAAISRRLAHAGYDPLLLQPHDVGLHHRFDAAILIGVNADPGVWFGLGGVLAVAEHLWPDAARRDRLAQLAVASLDSSALEPMKGHPGYMLLAAQLHARTHEERWAEFWSRGAERLFAEWHHDDELGWLWTQLLAGNEDRYLGAAHGLAGNVHVLRRGGALADATKRDEIERRAVETLTRLSVVEDGHATWPTGAGDPLIVNDRIRLQWCHGAAGVVSSTWDLAPDDDAWSELLLAAGRLVWDAGPIRAEPGLSATGRRETLMRSSHCRDERATSSGSIARVRSHSMRRLRSKSARRHSGKDVIRCSRATKASRCPSHRASPATPASPCRIA